MTTEGVVLMAFGKRAYYRMAFNMAVSIKYHSPDMRVALITEGRPLLAEHELKYFDTVIQMNRSDAYDGDKLNPGKAKTRIYKYLPYTHNIYLDVDGVAMQDLNPLMQLCRDNGSYYLTQVVGYHDITKGRDFQEMQWAWADDIWEHFGLLKTDILPAINSSFAYIRKCDEAESLYGLISDNFDNPMTKLRMPWGATQPDELYTNVALAQMEVNCDVGLHPVFFSTGVVKSWTEIKVRHYVLGIFGGVGFSHSSVTDMYDRLLFKVMASRGLTHQYKAHHLMRDKHANNRAPMS